jgi:hypothetical protein
MIELWLLGLELGLSEMTGMVGAVGVVVVGPHWYMTGNE